MGGELMAKKVFLDVVKLICIAMSLFQIYVATTGSMIPNTQRSIHLVFAALLASLLYPAKLKSEKVSLSVNGIYVFLLIIVGGYIVYQTRTSYAYQIALNGLSGTDILMGSMLIALMLESARRTTGWALPALAVSFLLYALFGAELPGLLGHKGYSWETLVDQLVFTSEGILGQPLGVSSTFVAMFIIFGAFFECFGRRAMVYRYSLFDCR
jgi:TRAP-type uncharacterized transport system fused permease subunit